MQFLALFSAPCYHKMAVKEMTPSLALLFLKLAGSWQQITGLHPSKRTYQARFLRCFWIPSASAVLSTTQDYNYVQKLAEELHIVYSFRRNHPHLPHPRQDRMALAALLLLQSATREEGE